MSVPLAPTTRSSTPEICRVCRLRLAEPSLQEQGILACSKCANPAEFFSFGAEFETPARSQPLGPPAIRRGAVRLRIGSLTRSRGPLILKA